MNLPEWRIIENRVDIFDEATEDHAFVGFRNAGYVAHNTPTKNYFTDKTFKFFKFLFELKGFDKTLFVERIGVRSRFCQAFEGSFEDLRDKYTSNYLTLTDTAKKVIRAEVLDVGSTINFADEYGNFNTVCGPMVKEQISEYFRGNENYPDVGLYYDIDYWLKPEKKMDAKDILSGIMQFAISSRKRFEDMSELILG